MDERPVGPRDERPRAARGGSLAIGGSRYPIVSEDATSCVIEGPPDLRIRGHADIYDGERHRAHCLVVLSEREGAFLRVIYKRRTVARTEPPPDYAAEPAPPVLPPRGWRAELAARLAQVRPSRTKRDHRPGPVAPA